MCELRICFVAFLAKVLRFNTLVSLRYYCFLTFSKTCARTALVTDPCFLGHIYIFMLLGTLMTTLGALNRTSSLSLEYVLYLCLWCFRGERGLE